MCDIILSHAADRFEYRGHLLAAQLLVSSRFEEFHQTFPESLLTEAVAAYPLLQKESLRTELACVYSRDDFREVVGALGLLELFREYEVTNVFPQATSLLQIVITTPVVTAESERCFSTLKRIKTFQRNTMGEARLTALGMLSMESGLVKSMPDFNTKVVEKFASLKNRRGEFFYKPLPASLR